MNKKAIKIGVVLSGCGFQDGAEIHESVLTLLSIQRMVQSMFVLRQIFHSTM